MNTAIPYIKRTEYLTLRQELSDYYSITNRTLLHNKFARSKEIKRFNGQLPSFRKLDMKGLNDIWPILCNEPGRTTDFSYGGLLMWVDWFKYEYAVLNNTVFIKGRLENDVTTKAFALPVGEMPLEDSLGVLMAYCSQEGIPLELSAVPEYAVEQITGWFSPQNVLPLDDWSDYLYDAEMLASLSGKKMNKKRNHVNKFLKLYPDYEFKKMDKSNVEDAIKFMDKFDKEGDDTPMAVEERLLTRKMLEYFKSDTEYMHGAILYAAGMTAGFTVGDVKGDTLFVHIEKCTREIDGSYEVINREFVNYMRGIYPEIKFVNREDDSGDPGLRRAKESYHPIGLLKKFNVVI